MVWRDPFYLVGRKAHAGASLKDLAAMRLGVVSEVPTPWYCLRSDLEDAGVVTATLRTVNNLTMPQQLEALAAGRLDVVQLFEPHASRALANGHAILYAAASRGLWSRTTALSKAGFDRLAYGLHDGGFIAHRATYAECVQDFGSRD